jgi:hypothetical protein
VGELEDRSVKLIARGTVPAVIFAANEITGADALFAVMRFGLEYVLLPPKLVTVSNTVYVPGTVYVCDGFWVVFHPPSPNDQAHADGELEEVSVKLTVKGTVPEVMFAVKEATGGTGLVTVM